MIMKNIYHEQQTDWSVISPLETASAQKIWPVKSAAMSYFMHTQFCLQFLDQIGFNKENLFDPKIINERVNQYIKQGKAIRMP
jgi:hypothetical protein